MQTNANVRLDDDAIKNFLERSVVRLTAAGADPGAHRDAIIAYIREGCELSLVGSELIDFFCVSTPNIVEAAGFSGAGAEEIVALFDELHDRFWRAERA